jgi:Putative beta-barrel porin-2, OmpL-like. bbp2
LIHPSLRALVAIVVGVGAAVGARTAEAATHDVAQNPTSVAQTDAATPAPTASPPSFKVHGSADVGFTRIQSPGVLTGRTFQPAADQNTPTLQNIYLGASFNTAPLGGEVDVSLGPDADVIAPYETNSRPGGFPGSRAKGWDVTQAFITHKCDKTGAWISLGKFEELSGVEKIESAKDWNYSRSILFAVNPYSETGARAGFGTANDKVHVTLGEVFGWNDIRETSTSGAATNLRTSEASLKIRSSSNVMWKLTANLGKAQDDNLVAGLVQPGANGLPLTGIRRSYDGVVTGRVNKKLTLVGNYNYGQQDNVALFNRFSAFSGIGAARWQGGAAYAHYEISSKWSGTLRAELFRDTGGFTTGFDQKVGEQTATLQYAWSAPLLLRLEYRNDDSDQAVFGRTGVDPVKFQHTLAAEAVVRY